MPEYIVKKGLTLHNATYVESQFIKNALPENTICYKYDVYLLKNNDFTGVDLSKYDLIISADHTSTTNGVAAIAAEIAKNIESYRKDGPVIELDPKTIYPTQHIRDFAASRIEDYRFMDMENKNPCSSDTVTCAISDQNVFALDGHHRMVAGILNKKDFIHIQLEAPEHITILDRSDYYDYEDMTGITFDYYPDLQPLKMTEQELEFAR